MLTDGDTRDFRLLGLLEVVREAIVVFEPSGQIVFATGRAERLFGFDAGELAGQLVETLLPDLGVAVARALRGWDRRAGRVGPKYQLEGRCRDGSGFVAEVSLTTVQSRPGVLVAAMISDLGERQRAETMFRDLLEAAPDAIVGVNRSGMIRLVNAQTERLFGYDRDELIGRPVEMLIPRGAQAAHPLQRARYFAAPVPRPMGAGVQLAGRRKDGSEFPADISLSALETEDGLLVSAAIRDVTERLEAQVEQERLRSLAEQERLEARLMQSRRLESLGQLAGGVAHDFNNLLGVISGYTAFVAEAIETATDASEEPWQAARDDVAEIERAVERATRLTRQLLAFGRREVVQPVVLSLNEVVSEIERLLRRTLGEQVELVIRLSAGLWLVRADVGQLEQVLVNLAINARDAMPAGGTLVIETSNVEADAHYAVRRPALTPGRYVRLRVSDTGCGMPREVLERAFEPFFTTKPTGESAGLGLATTYGIVTQGGGDIEIHSEPGVGTTISATLPATDEPRARPVSSPPASGWVGGGETVLLVEDEPAMREVTRRLLMRNGYRVIAAGSGPEAIRFAAEHDGPIDLLLTDVVMPRMLGRELAEQITALQPQTTVLFMSGYARPILDAHGSLASGIGLVEKPFTEATLLARLRASLTPDPDGPATEA